MHKYISQRLYNHVTFRNLININITVLKKNKHYTKADDQIFI